MFFSESPTLYSAAGGILFMAALVAWDLAESALRKYRSLIVLLSIGLFASAASAQQPKILPDPDFPGFSIAYHTAVKTGKPLVVFIGCAPRSIPGAVVGQASYLAGYPAQSIMVGSPGTNPVDWKATLPAKASDTDIRAAFAAKGGQANLPVPFSEVPQASAPAVVADADRTSPVGDYWIPPEFVEYQRARYTQSIASLIDLTPTMDIVPRTRSEVAWQVPGGMEGVVGWKSRLFKFIPSPPIDYKGGIEVQNSSFGFQVEQGWIRRYPNGTVFMDVLSTDKGVFEVRKREKLDGQWYSLVEFRDRKARPVGYHGLRFNCVQCHFAPGFGGYNTGLVSGSDTVFSDPMPFEPR